MGHIKNGTVIEYKGYTLTKKKKSSWIIAKDDSFGYARTLKMAKEVIDEGINRNKNSTIS